MAQDREESQGFFEMLWDCEFCDTKGLLAKSQRFCANCGGPQNPDKRYFPQAGQEVRVDGHKFEGADRACPACNSPMGAMAKNCTHCGSPLDGSAEVRGKIDAPPPQAARPPQPARKRRKIWPIVLAAIVLIGVAIWFRFLRTHEATVEVTGHSWKREIVVEEYKDGPETAWRSQLPPDATIPTCIAKEHGTRQVPDGEECHTERRDKKDGTFEQVKKCSPKTKSEPIMDQWCTFSARRWRPVNTVENHGTGLSPTWPTQGLPPADAPVLLGSKRSGKRTDTNTLELKGHGTCDVSEDIWRKYTDGQKVKVEVRPSGDVACGSL